MTRLVLTCLQHQHLMAPLLMVLKVAHLTGLTMKFQKLFDPKLLLI